MFIDSGLGPILYLLITLLEDCSSDDQVSGMMRASLGTPGGRKLKSLEASRHLGDPVGSSRSLF
jgi:hypothetical protein